VVKVGIVVLLFVVVIGALVYACLRPARILGVDGEQLAYSVSGAVDSPFPGRCEKRKGERWVCGTFDEKGKVAVRYRVIVDGSGCWDGRRLAEIPDAPETRKEASGCITVLDYLELGGPD
jgi:hypothetical protein